MNTMLLDASAWDLVLDADGNIALATEPYSLAQDAASAIKLFQGELYYDTTQGIPWFADVLGKLPPLPLLKQLLVNAALTVPGVTSAQVFVSSLTERTVAGQVQVTDSAGNPAVAPF